MPSAAKRAGMVGRHLRIQRFISGFVGYHASVFENGEIRAFENLVVGRTNKTNFHFFSDSIQDSRFRPETQCMPFMSLFP
jgi:hypothetical protein